MGSEAGTVSGCVNDLALFFPSLCSHLLAHALFGYPALTGGLFLFTLPEDSL